MSSVGNPRRARAGAIFPLRAFTGYESKVPREGAVPRATARSWNPAARPRAGGDLSSAANATARRVGTDLLSRIRPARRAGRQLAIWTGKRSQKVSSGELAIPGNFEPSRGWESGSEVAFSPGRTRQMSNAESFP